MVPAARMTTSASSAQKTVDNGTVAVGSVAAVPVSVSDMTEGNGRDTLKGRAREAEGGWESVEEMWLSRGVSEERIRNQIYGITDPDRELGIILPCVPQAVDASQSSI